MFRTLVLILLFVVLLVVIYKIIKSLIKVVIIAIILIIISLGAFGFMFYKDLKDMRSFDNSSNLFVLQDKGNVLTAFQLQNGSEPFQEMGEDELKDIQSSLSSKETKELEEAHGRVFVFSMAFFEGMSGGINLTDDLSLSREDILSILRTGGGSALGLEGEKLRTMVFFAAVTKTVDERGMGYVLEQYRAETIEVYPQTILFSVVRWTPEFLVKPLIRGDK